MKNRQTLSSSAPQAPSASYKYKYERTKTECFDVNVAFDEFEKADVASICEGEGVEGETHVVKPFGRTLFVL